LHFLPAGILLRLLPQMFLPSYTCSFATQIEIETASTVAPARQDFTEAGAITY
jgi:hypothetical protein